MYKYNKERPKWFPRSPTQTRRASEWIHKSETLFQGKFQLCQPQAKVVSATSLKQFRVSRPRMSTSPTHNRPGT